MACIAPAHPPRDLVTQRVQDEGSSLPASERIRELVASGRFVADVLGWKLGLGEAKALKTT